MLVRYNYPRCTAPCIQNALLSAFSSESGDSELFRGEGKVRLSDFHGMMCARRHDFNSNPIEQDLDLYLDFFDFEGI